MKSIIIFQRDRNFYNTGNSQFKYISIKKYIFNIFKKKIYKSVEIRDVLNFYYNNRQMISKKAFEKIAYREYNLGLYTYKLHILNYFYYLNYLTTYSIAKQIIKFYI